MKRSNEIPTKKFKLWNDWMNMKEIQENNFNSIHKSRYVGISDKIYLFRVSLRTFFLNISFINSLLVLPLFMCWPSHIILKVISNRRNRTHRSVDSIEIAFGEKWTNVIKNNCSISQKNLQLFALFVAINCGE